MSLAFSFNCFSHSTHYGLPPTLPDQIMAASSAGYEHVGLDVPSLLAHEAAGVTAQELRDVLDRAEVTTFEIVPLSLSGDAGAVRASLDTVVRFGSALGARHVLGTARGGIDAALTENLKRAAAFLGDAGLRLSLEFMPFTALSSLTRALELLDTARLDDVGVVLDVWHFALGAAEWPLLETVPLARLGFLQLDDALANADGQSHHACMDERVLPGEGDLPLARILHPLLRRGFDGVVSVEVLSRSWRERAIDEFAHATLQASLATVEASR